MTPSVIHRTLALGRKRFANLLTVTTVALYAVLATGAAATTSETACSNWPFCAEWGAPSTATLFVLGHQLLTGLAGILLVVALVAAIRSEVSRPVQLLLGTGTILFVVQVAVGALLAAGQVGVSSQLHLLVGSAIFGTLLVALGWTLEDPSVEGQPLQPENIDSMAAPRDSSGDDQAVTARATRGWKATATAYLELTKPRLMWLLCLLALAGVALATTTGARPTGMTVVATLAGGVLAIGASGTFNHVAERERDKRMDRTADRPVATDQIPRRNAAVFGVALLVLSMVVMIGLVNIVAALLTLVAVGYYSVVYTIVLKPNTSWNIAIGGGAGALPAVIGWAAVTGSVGVPALVLAGLVVVWTPAHFYNLAIVYRDDYARAGYPMYPVVSGVPAARQRIMTTLGMTLLVAVLLLAVTPLGMLFALSTVAVGAVFLGALVVQCHTRTDAATLRTFHASNAYLGVILLAIVIEAVLVL